eukprot:TRINITY_DN67230_c0_g1_i1.p3 TRINITY_DN67230_c0_g1~~TRINITY_DN67230_c0_g1_i1.p3  ORF type:complete len:334 (+),score=111.97 TRINITY_DN67230_c0_g1_i1:89-1003(+)
MRGSPRARSAAAELTRLGVALCGTVGGFPAAQLRDAECICPYCSREFSTAQRMYRHARRRHFGGAATLADWRRRELRAGRSAARVPGALPGRDNPAAAAALELIGRVMAVVAPAPRPSPASGLAAAGGEARWLCADPAAAAGGAVAALRPGGAPCGAATFVWSDPLPPQTAFTVALAEDSAAPAAGGTAFGVAAGVALLSAAAAPSGMTLGRRPGACTYAWDGSAWQEGRCVAAGGPPLQPGSQLRVTLGALGLLQLDPGGSSPPPLLKAPCAARQEGEALHAAVSLLVPGVTASVIFHRQGAG